MVQKKRKILGFLTTEKPQKTTAREKGKNGSENSSKIVKKRPKNRREQSLFFLGKQRRNNQKTYEQMFVSQKGANRG